MAGYWCEVLAEGEVYGTREIVAYWLGTFQTISPKLALRWLGTQALRIADGLDPDPASSPWFSGRTCEATPTRDAPAELRMWRADVEHQRAARECIKGGDPLFVVVRDMDCRYTLSVWPVRVPVPDIAPHQPSPWSYEPSADRAHGLAPSPSTTRAGYSCGAGAPSL
ncbi:hypothetical protein GCM10023084_07610 [Streptomyces lacrimifluminis]|uniref:Uncharacterized protein n=1 Tax=Streptomyces lacrimifluminis TaxID=1500077 RepID=A0A917KQZ8_9ACTN|nr:hypothetical protein GCM10012282_22270 [Streptomyces lacrimifluminis]